MLLGDIADLYQPVHFNHKLHASMAQMGGDCATCHHFSPPGRIPPCKECHSPSGESSDLRKPNLKGAYHRQCLACHREWSHETQCVLCHIPSEGGAIAQSAKDPTDIIGTPHPKIVAPDKRLYTTPYKPGPMVTFYHEEHIQLFNLRCVDCHKQENCGSCHDMKREVKIAKTQEEVHAICNDCHNKDACAKCHDTKERSAFSHADTGWPLSRFHQKLECRACHPTGKKIARLNNNCSGCHGGWNQANFKHAIVGLQLDEVHIELECSDCHENKNFAATPKCDGCHDDGRTHKDAPPGELIRK